MRSRLAFLALLALVGCDGKPQPADEAPPGDSADPGPDDTAGPDEPDDTAAPDDTAEPPDTADTADTAEPEPALPDYAGCSGLVNQDYGRDGVSDGYEGTTYDDAGNLVEEWSDDDADGQREAITTRAYDEAGNLLAEELDADGDGVIDQASYFTYDGAGATQTWEVDTDGDGVINDVGTYVYDGDGLLERLDYDAGGDGTVDATYAYAYDADGRLASVEVTSAAGDLLARTTYTWSEDGLGLLVEEDLDGDEIVDITIQYTYDEAGLLVEYEDDDGVNLWAYKVAYDELGRISGANGTLRDSPTGQFIYAFVYEYRYDLDGREDLLLMDFDLDQDFQADDYGITFDFTWTCPP